MASFWFTSAPLPGHLDWGGLLKTAQALRARGHEVTWVSEARIRRSGDTGRACRSRRSRTPAGAGPRRRSPELHVLPGEDAVVLRYRRALDTWLSEDCDPARSRGICASWPRADGPPDVMVTDPFLSGGGAGCGSDRRAAGGGGWPAGPPLDEDQLLVVQRHLGRRRSGASSGCALDFGLTASISAAARAESCRVRACISATFRRTGTRTKRSCRKRNSSADTLSRRR